MNWVDLLVVKWVVGKVFLIFYCDKHAQKRFEKIDCRNSTNLKYPDFLAISAKQRFTTTYVGTVEGKEVGLMDGINVGYKVGVVVGVPDGRIEGDIEGYSDGLDEGLLEGCSVG